MWPNHVDTELLKTATDRLETVRKEIARGEELLPRLEAELARLSALHADPAQVKEMADTLVYWRDRLPQLRESLPALERELERAKEASGFNQAWQACLEANAAVEDTGPVREAYAKVLACIEALDEAVSAYVETYWREHKRLKAVEDAAHEMHRMFIATWGDRWGVPPHPPILNNIAETKAFYAHPNMLYVNREHVTATLMLYNKP